MTMAPVNARSARREAFRLTESVAAAAAGVSLATWRRWEEDPATVSPTMAVLCQEVFDKEAAYRGEVVERAGDREDVWGYGYALGG